jgi:hypothetical protein
VCNVVSSSYFSSSQFTALQLVTCAEALSLIYLLICNSVCLCSQLADTSAMVEPVARVIPSVGQGQITRLSSCEPGGSSQTPTVYPTHPNLQDPQTSQTSLHLGYVSQLWALCEGTVCVFSGEYAAKTWDYSVCSVHWAVRVKDSAVLVVSMLLASMLKNWLIASSSHVLSAKASCFWHIIDMKQAIFRGIPSEVQQTTVSPQFSGARR